MPNWCNNHVEIQHDDPTVMAKIHQAFQTDNIFESLFPLPLMGENTARDHWGTKWDIESEDVAVSAAGDTVSASFLTAWSPPIGVYEKLRAMGCQVYAKYWEGGVGYFGYWENGNDEESSYDGMDDIPDDIWDTFGLDESCFPENSKNNS